MFLFLVLFTLLFVAAAFGAIYLLLRKTLYAPYAPLLSLISFQPFLLVCVTLLGYRRPFPLVTAHVFLPVMAGVCLTVIVVFRHRSEIVAVLRNTWKSSLLIYALTIASMALATPILVDGLAYIDWWNGELVNYSYFAQYFLGLLHDPNYIPGFEENTSIRYGAELFLAALSALTSKAPLLLVEVLEALHKVSAIVGFAVLCEILRKERRLLPGAVILADVGFAFSTILSLNHMLAFLAAQAITASFILVSLGSLSGSIRSRRVQAFLAIHVLFILITYGEGLPILLLLGALVIIEALWRKRPGVAIALLTVFGTGLLVNPLLLVQRFGHLYRLRMIVAGFNVLGNPKDDLWHYMSAALGFQYPFLDVPSLPVNVLSAGVVLSTVAIIAASTIAAFRLRTVLFLAVPLLLVLMHFQLGTRGQPVSSAYYKGYKAIAALDFYIFFALGVMVDTLLKWRSRLGVSRVVQVVLLVSACVFITGNIFVSSTAAAAIRRVPSVYYEADIRRALREGQGPVLVVTSGVAASVWDLMANYLGRRRLLLDRKQAEVVYHNSSIALLEPTAYLGPREDGIPRAADPELVFAGTIIVPQIVAYTPAPQSVNIRAVLDAVSPGMRLRERKLFFETPAFRVLDGMLISTGDPSAGPDGNPNKAPSIVGVKPNQGRGDKVSLSFTYSDPNGFSDIAGVVININSTQTNVESCYISYGRIANQLGLARDDGINWDTAIVGSKISLENSRCAIDAGHSSIGTNNNELTLHLSLKFKRPLAGKKTLYTSVIDESKQTTGWQGVGWWDIP